MYISQFDFTLGMNLYFVPADCILWRHPNSVKPIETFTLNGYQLIATKMKPKPIGYLGCGIHFRFRGSNMLKSIDYERHNS